jgi:membrane dipeptidase
MKKSLVGARLKDLFIFDAHCDTANVLHEQPWTFKKNPAHLDLRKIKQGGLKAQIFAIWVDPLFAPHCALKKALQLLYTMEQKVFAPQHALKVTTLAEMTAAQQQGKLAAWLFLEGGHIIENSPEILHIFYSLGVRGLTLTHSKNTDWADSTTDQPRANGLTTLGRQIVKQMAHMGMAIDVSHASDRTIEHVLQSTTVPIMASHSNARKLCPVPRNLSDDLIRAIAARRGFIGVNFSPAFIKRQVYEQIEAYFSKCAKEIQTRTKGHLDDPEFLSQVEWEYYQRSVIGNEKVVLNDLIDHITHIAFIGGINCVGLGSDFDGISSTPGDLKNSAAYPALVAGLQKRGYHEKEIRKICGLNLKDFMRRVERKGREK